MRKSLILLQLELPTLVVCLSWLSATSQHQDTWSEWAQGGLHHTECRGRERYYSTSTLVFVHLFTLLKCHILLIHAQAGTHTHFKFLKCSRIFYSEH